MASEVTVGFTGTQQGMTYAQKKAVRKILQELTSYGMPFVKHVVHGGCIGADAQFHRMALNAPFDIVVYFSDIKHKQAKLAGIRTKRVTVDPSRLPPLMRNELIVRRSAIMIATPATNHEHLRSGTWATVRRARDYDRELYLVRPDGKVRYERTVKL